MQVTRWLDAAAPEPNGWYAASDTASNAALRRLSPISFFVGTLAPAALPLPIGPDAARLGFVADLAPDWLPDAADVLPPR